MTTRFIKAGMECRTALVMLGGRFWEISDPSNEGINKPVNLPTGNGGQWWSSALSSGYYETGQEPKLGSVACFSDNNGRCRARCNCRRN